MSSIRADIRKRKVAKKTRALIAEIKSQFNNPTKPKETISIIEAVVHELFILINEEEDHGFRTEVPSST